MKIKRSNSIIDVCEMKKRISQIIVGSDFTNDKTGFFDITIEDKKCGKCSFYREDILEYSGKDICHMPYDNTPLNDVIASTASDEILFVDDNKEKAVFLRQAGDGSGTDTNSDDKLEDEFKYEKNDEELTK